MIERVFLARQQQILARLLQKGFHPRISQPHARNDDILRLLVENIGFVVLHLQIGPLLAGGYELLSHGEYGETVDLIERLVGIHPHDKPNLRKLLQQILQRIEAVFRLLKAVCLGAEVRRHQQVVAEQAVYGIAVEIKLFPVFFVKLLVELLLWVGERRLAVDDHRILILDDGEVCGQHQRPVHHPGFLQEHHIQRFRSNIVQHPLDLFLGLEVALGVPPLQELAEGTDIDIQYLLVLFGIDAVDQLHHRLVSQPIEHPREFHHGRFDGVLAEYVPVLFVLVAPDNVELPVSYQSIVYRTGVLAIEHAIAWLLHHNIYFSHIPGKLGNVEFLPAAQLPHEYLIEVAQLGAAIVILEWGGVGTREVQGCHPEGSQVLLHGIKWDYIDGGQLGSKQGRCGQKGLLTLPNTIRLPKGCSMQGMNEFWVSGLLSIFITRQSQRRSVLIRWSFTSWIYIHALLNWACRQVRFLLLVGFSRPGNTLRLLSSMQWLLLMPTAISSFGLLCFMVISFFRISSASFSFWGYLEVRWTDDTSRFPSLQYASSGYQSKQPELFCYQSRSRAAQRNVYFLQRMMLRLRNTRSKELQSNWPSMAMSSSICWMNTRSMLYFRAKSRISFILAAGSTMKVSCALVRYRWNCQTLSWPRSLMLSMLVSLPSTCRSRVMQQMKSNTRQFSSSLG